jgi:class 3 adenylate cyclase
VDFDTMLEQVLELIQRQRRVSYRAIKRRFDVDDDDLADLKEEILFAHPHIVDEAGRGLIWTDAEAYTMRSPPADPGEEPSSSAVDTPLTAPFSEAERRQLTVMFCDLVGSTPLSEQLDPEDLREVVRAYQQTCAQVVQRFDGHIAQFLGDGLLVYFGWSQAHEDDAQRAVRAGLGMVDALGTFNTRLERERGLRLAIRVGIHTGLVVVGEMGGGGHQEQLALGDTPNIASRIQGLAAPNTIVMSAAASQLVQGYFTCQALGAHTLKGVAAPMPVYRVLGESGAQSRLEVATSRGLTPFVGREQAVRLLVERWEHAQEGHGQIVLLSGEAGIGKSRLVQVLKDHVATTPHTRWECRSLPYYQHTALYPITERLSGNKDFLGRKTYSV